MTDITLEQLRTELAPIMAKIDVLQEAFETLRRDTRSLRAAMPPPAADR